MRWMLPSLATVVIAIGCDQGPPPIQTAPVSGTATYQGKPLEEYRVFFYISGGASQEPATGRVGPDGKFTMGVREPGDGAIVGLNQVWVKYDPEKPEQIPGKEVPFVPPPPKVKIPEKYTSRDTSGITVEVPPEGLENYKLELE